MTETIAAKIADGEDLLRPSNWRGHNLEPYTAAKVLRVKSYDPGEFTCSDCDTCLDDPPTPVCINGSYIVQCTPGKVRKVAPAEIAVYEIDVRALSRYLSETWCPGLKEANVARFWFKVCTDMDLLSALADAINDNWRHQTAIVDTHSGMDLYDKIYKLVEARRRQNKTV